MKVFLINLDRRPDRLAEMTERLNALGLEFERISAFDGSTQPSLHLVDWVKATIFNFFVVPSAGVIGCYQSHKFVWQRIVDDQTTQALVLEDDAMPVDWDPVVLKVELADIGIDLLRLEATDFRHPMGQSGNVKLIGRQLCNIQTSGAAAYVISAGGARKCLSLGKFWFPADTYDVVGQLTGLKSAVLIPAMWHQSQSVSDLRDGQNDSKSDFGKVLRVGREFFWRVRRPWLRAARKLLVNFEVWRVRNKVVGK